MIGPDRGGNLVAHRCSAWGRQGAVSSSAPEAAWIGRDVLRDGGNAFDAAVATALAETVLTPSKCGLAGDVVALVRRAGEESPRAMVAIGPAAAGLDRAVAEPGLPLTGGLSVGVPAAPAGYAALAGLGRIGLADLVAPAVTLADGGFPWSPLNTDYTRRSAGFLRRENPDGTVFMPGEEPIPTGQWVRLPGHVRVLEEFAARGPAVFDSPLGDALVDAVARRGGVIERSDLGAARSEWSVAPSTTIDGRRVWATPTPTHGPALLDALRATGSGPATYEGQVARVHEARARQSELAGDGPRDGGTSIVTAVDAEGNAVVVVHSLSHPTFGSGIVVPGLDIVLSNRAGRGFDSDLAHPNAPRPGRRPMTTLHAWALRGFDDDELVLGATSGGAQQMPWNLQVIERLLHQSGPEHRHSLAPAALEPLWASDPTTHVTRREGVEVPVWGLTSGVQLVRTPGAEGVCHVVTDIRSIGGVAAL